MSGRPAARNRGSARTAPSRVDRRRRAQARRARVVLAGSVVFSGVVLGTSFPVGELLAQHRQLADNGSQVRALQAENSALQRQAGHLDDAATVRGLARSDFGLVAPGQQAYDVLPPAGSSTSSALSGHVPLDGPPVVPGSAESQDLLGAGNDGAPPAPAGAGSGAGAPRPARVASRTSTGSDPTSFLGRLAHTLEFWR